MPATRAALYTVKPTIGLVSTAGIIPISPFADSAGPMAESSCDVADLLDVLVDETKTIIPRGGYRSCRTGSIANLRIGSLDPKVWKYPPYVTKPTEVATKQMVSDKTRIR
jgi:amidase